MTEILFAFEVTNKEQKTKGETQRKIKRSTVVGNKIKKKNQASIVQ